MPEVIDSEGHKHWIEYVSNGPASRVFRFDANSRSIELNLPAEHPWKLTYLNGEYQVCVVLGDEYGMRN